MQHTFFYDYLHHLSPFELGSAVKATGEEEHGLNNWTMVLVKHPMAKPGGLIFLLLIYYY